MKKIYNIILMFILMISLNGCKSNKSLDYSNLEVTLEMESMFKEAFSNSIDPYIEENISLDNIKLLDYYGKIGKAYVVSMDSEYSKEPYNVVPHNIHQETIEKMRFAYDKYNNKVYIVYENELYTPSLAYDGDIINLDNLCNIFALHTSGKNDFTKKDYNMIFNVLESKGYYLPEFTLKQYYGHYNDYTIVSFYEEELPLPPIGLVSKAKDYIYNFYFEYNDYSEQIRFINKEEIKSFWDMKYYYKIPVSNVIDVFEIHTNSEDIDEELVETLLYPFFRYCLNHNSCFTYDIEYDDMYLKHYYGEYNGSYIYSFYTSRNLKTYKIEELENKDEIIAVQEFLDSLIHVLNNGTLYTLTEAVDNGIISKDIEQEVLSK